MAHHLGPQGAAAEDKSFIKCTFAPVSRVGVVVGKGCSRRENLKQIVA